MTQLALIILAAGKGTRMKSDLPKVLHPVAGAPLVVHAMLAVEALEPAATIVVAGHGADLVERAAHGHDPDARIVLQAEQRGTAHAVDRARGALEQFDGDVIVLYGDTPFIRPETMTEMLDARRGGADVVVLGFEAEQPGKYGRLVTNGDVLERIVEAKDASAEELAITLCNSGVICADRATLFDLIAQVGDDNAAGEYYLTDIIGLASGAGMRCAVVTCPEEETLGINSRAELARAEAIWQARRRHEAMENGATLTAPDTVFFAHDTHIGADVLIEPHVIFGPGVTVENGATLRAFSHLEGCHVSDGAVIGPYARLRPDAEIGPDARIGNFVEIKKAVIGEGAKVNHLSYIGDAEIGAGANIGAGTITCNYDGVLKHETRIGAGAFIGSNTALVAPVEVGEGAVVAAGSTITADVPGGGLAIARSRQDTKPGQGARLREALLARKAADT
ncbi:bifunctional UDP-N-acetylglucosamine diphosphorylase/glucosamine-1-phosphate N-acetyltransferase GlmU [Pelagivirga sediminicola]|uniref:Bifunctional protein GlmU n=1 Tax=Pelagivirga sediminicola TaxID=2170575 RepID=A0A2T7G5A6_9RHOB|nr:bifunctional UDP-N-acetylglucosamine diphosphorylase/glucosamine-1-phosphate N-acetyltransferase GlmU [Pelagivirga sediminicola]PVA09595.1 bifunctional UDP-N-acetylglucosamine diphosphorylase/glucosamine-1-phosphate N-acetyltransferase GlmU [Pelagivirga sediminicola]